MTKELEIEFTGAVSQPSRLTGQGEGQFAVVLLTTLTEGYKFAVINMNTRGRCDVLSQIGGKFTPGVSVKGRGTKGPDGIVATHIELAR